eukprot:365597-Amphidinium_carterae.1
MFADSMFDVYAERAVSCDGMNLIDSGAPNLFGNLWHLKPATSMGHPFVAQVVNESMDIPISSMECLEAFSSYDANPA